MAYQALCSQLSIKQDQESIGFPHLNYWASIFISHSSYMPENIDLPLKNKLDTIYLRYSQNWLESDPIQIPHLYTTPEDIEISAFIAALFSYGKVDFFLPKIKQIMNALGPSPAKSVRDKSWGDHPDLKNFYYRFQKKQDLIILLQALSRILYDYGSLKLLFLNRSLSGEVNILSALYDFVSVIREHMSICSEGKISHGVSHLVPSPSGGTMKRLNMFLRWMVRKDSVDFGLWNEISPSQLIIPVDTHIHRMAINLNLCQRKNADIKTAIEITNSLKKLSPDDPVKYDFALTRMGMFQCKATSIPDCHSCILQEHCIQSRPDNR